MAGGRPDAQEPHRKVFLEHVVTLRAQQDFEGGVLTFTEYRATQEMLRAVIERTFPGIPIALINGTMGLNKKRAAVAQLRTEGGFLVSTEAGGEGLNLHDNCHVLFNFDLPWNPMRLQQRIGRLERYGQRRRVLVFNMRNAGAIEDKLRHYLDLKLERVERALQAVPKRSWNCSICICWRTTLMGVSRSESLETTTAAS